MLKDSLQILDLEAKRVNFCCNGRVSFACEAILGGGLTQLEII